MRWSSVETTAEGPKLMGLCVAVLLKDTGSRSELKALLVLRDMLQRMGHHDHPVINQAKKLFVKWRTEYQPEDGKAKKGNAKGKG